MSRRVATMERGPRYFHGGKPGLRPGDMLVPGHDRDHNHPGCPICEARAAGKDPGLDRASQRQDRIYVTSDREYARYYASLYGRGDLYRVEPVGVVEVSKEDQFPTWTCERARVIALYAVGVVLTWSERRRLYRRWAALEGVTRPDADRQFERMIGDLAAALGGEADRG